jgi:hypothetical protein
MSPSTFVCAVLVALASGAEEEMWGPSDSVKAFGAMEAALKKITSLPASPEMSKKAHKVADDVRGAIAFVESHQNITKAQKNEKIAAAMKELQGYAMDLQKSTEVLQSEEKKMEHLKDLKSQLAEKKKELLKDESMIKLYTLQKELAEKKLQLQKLIEKKNQAKASKSALAEDAKAESALVGKLMKLTGSLPTDKKAELPAPIKAALSEVKAFSKKESDELTKMEKDSKQTMAALDAEMKKSLPTTGKDDALAKGQQMMKRLKKEEHRTFMKAQVQKKAQLAELKTIEQSIEQHDAKKLTAALLKMQHEAKAAAAKSGDFLH